MTSRPVTHETPLQKNKEPTIGTQDLDKTHGNNADTEVRNRQEMIEVDKTAGLRVEPGRRQLKELAVNEGPKRASRADECVTEE